jgi:hypothetical protein
MTLVEFLHPIRSHSVSELCLATMYYEDRYGGRSQLTVEDLRALLKRGRVPRSASMNIADILAKSAPYVDATGKDGKRFLWVLTSSGMARVRTLLGLPEVDAEVEHDVSTLEKLVAKVSDKDVADYVEEAIKCLQVGALRAAVVFLWVGAVRTIQQKCIAMGAAQLDAAIRRHEPKSRAISKVDDLEYVKESVLLLAAQDIGAYDKNQRSVLTDGLNLRNKCGHPGEYKPGPKKVSAFVEDIVGIVFPT